MKKRFTLSIELDCAALTSDGQADAVAVLLHGLAASLELDGFLNAGEETRHGAAANLWGRNGNWCGFWRVVLADLEADPYRWEHLTLPELEALRPAINSRMRELHCHGRDCDEEQAAESKTLEAVFRQLNQESANRE